jgi:putative ABC transport system ATP-binding protein
MAGNGWASGTHPDMPLIQTRGLGREYHRGSERVMALNDVDLEVKSAERVAVMGPSGSGKSTLVSLIGGLDSPTAGRVILAGKDLTRISAKELAMLRRNVVSFILQTASLIPMLTVSENIELPLALNGVEQAERTVRSTDLLDLIFLSDKASSLPEELSGGQQQRVAVARAVASRPQLVLADEPAGSLDSETAASVLSLISGICRDEGIALVMVTHEEDDTRHADRVVRLRDGMLISDEQVSGAPR